MAKQKDGRRNRYQFQAHLLLPEPASQEPAIGGVLALLAGAGARLQLTGTGPASRPPHPTRSSAMDPDHRRPSRPGPSPDEPRRPCRRRAQRRTRHRSRPCPASIPRIAPRCRQPLTGLSRASCRDASGLAVLMSTGRRAGLPGLSRPAAPAPPLARVVRITGPGRQIDIFSHRQLQRWGLPGIANTGG